MRGFIRMACLSATAAMAALALASLAYAAMWVALVLQLACGVPPWVSLLLYLIILWRIVSRVVSGPRKV